MDVEEIEEEVDSIIEDLEEDLEKSGQELDEEEFLIGLANQFEHMEE